MDRLINILKTSKLFYKIYNFTISSIIKFFGLFINVDDKIILFNSFGGKKFDDSPRVIYEYMLNQTKYDKYKFYWAFNNPNKFEIGRAKKIKNNSIKFFLIALKAKYWITNSGIERGLKFKSKNTIYINTWHGSPIKHIGIDENNLKIKFNTSKPNIYYSQSEFDRKIFSRVFDINEDNIALCGLPRNDELVNVNEKEVREIKEKLNLPIDKKIILYAPTYREYCRDGEGCIFRPPINFELWKEKLSDDYILLFRAHYEITKSLKFTEDSFFKDFSNYNNLNEILKLADILITDYSSLMIDYSILERPILNYVYDYDEYNLKRGLYFDIREKLPGSCFKDEMELINKILNLNFKEERIKTIKFKNEFVQICGNSRKFIDNIIK